MMKTVVFIAALAIPAIASAVPARAADPSIKLDFAYQAQAIGTAPLWLAADDGLFRRYGIEASLTFVPKSPAIVAAVLSGDFKFAEAGEDAVIGADLSGGDVVILAVGSEKPLSTIWATQAVPTIHDLKGHRIGVTEAGTTTDFVARFILEKVGLVPGRDVTIIGVGASSNRFAALLAGQIDAAVLGSGDILKPEQLGPYHKIADLLDYDMLFYTDGLIARKSWVDAHRAETLNVLRAWLSGVAMVFQDQAATTAVIRKYTGTDDPKVLANAYRILTRATLKDSTPKPAALATGIAESKLPGAKNADARTFIDTSFIDELNRDGFVAQLYK